MFFLKKFVDLITLGLIALLLYGTVQADEHKAYVQLNAGAVFAPTNSFTPNAASGNNDLPRVVFDYDPGYATGLAVGYRVAERFRLEGELLYQSSNFDNDFVFANGSFGSSETHFNGERTRAAALLNGYYDFKNQTPFTPYITAGVGGYHVEFKSKDAYGLRNDFDVAYQVGAGVNYKVSDRFSFDLKYRYFSGADPHIKRIDDRFSTLFDVGDHQLMAGVRIVF
ncbi:outer membrane protein [Crenothrix sp.]|uniref:outer membrane protein n=1 Tax=Crenothrix sp. TaxID=3100433 RepID=UPI00374DFB20